MEWGDENSTHTKALVSLVLFEIVLLLWRFQSDLFVFYINYCTSEQCSYVSFDIQIIQHTQSVTRFRHPFMPHILCEDNSILQ